MTKRKFLNELEKKLYILNDEERKDIINEYKDTIEEKMKHGKTEQEAIEDFGSMDLLVEEILKAYKINPKFEKKEENKVKDVFEKSDSLIQKWSKSLSEFFRNLEKDCKENGVEITLELIFEWILKGILLLILCCIVKIPFALLEALGIGIFDFSFLPFDFIFIAIWKILLGVLYFIVCILLGIAMFKPYFAMFSKEQEEISVKKKEKIRKSNNITSPIVFLIKFIAIIFLGIPCCFITIAFSFLFAISIYFLFMGISSFGLLIFSFGFLLLFGMFTQIAFEFPRKKFSFLTTLFSSILIFLGGFLTLTGLSDYNYHEKLPARYSQKEKVYIEDISDFTTVTSDYGKNITINNDLPDGKIQIHVSYYDDYIKIKKDQVNGQIKIQAQYEKHYKTWKKNYHFLLNDLKEKEIYDYTDLYRYHVIIEANDNTSSKIR